ncbi:MAG: peptide chain release factor N(5)-glutamine methyltransferase [Candidatus Omnitrophica bacterium]|nr:peptide chain release factor N(5)-glutamine methyltransferase [Candidatus Omnitrophota bacterium]
MTQFLGIELKTTKDTFIPRPETELLVNRCLDVIGPDARILDIGTGSGNISIALTAARQDCRIVALEKSQETLSVARENAASLGVSERIDFKESDLLHILEHNNIYFDIIISNPPYIPSWEMMTLTDDVRREPGMALDGGEDGLSFYKRIISTAPKHLKSSGYLLMELGYNQAFSVKRLLEEAGYTGIELFKDFQGIERVIRARWIS